MHGTGSTTSLAIIEQYRPPMDRPPRTTRSGGSLDRRASSAAASRVDANKTAGRSGGRFPWLRYGYWNRSEGTPLSANASATAVSAAACISAPAPWARSTARSAPRLGPWKAYSELIRVAGTALTSIFQIKNPLPATLIFTRKKMALLI